VNKTQTKAFRKALLRGGFVVVYHGTANGITSTRLDLPGVVSCVLTTEDDHTFGVHFHWRRKPRRA